MSVKPLAQEHNGGLFQQHDVILARCYVIIKVRCSLIPGLRARNIKPENAQTKLYKNRDFGKGFFYFPFLSFETDIGLSWLALFPLASDRIRILLSLLKKPDAFAGQFPTSGNSTLSQVIILLFSSGDPCSSFFTAVGQ